MTRLVQSCKTFLNQISTKPKSKSLPMTSAENFGYPRGKPCIVVKMNNVFGWIPEPFYNLTEVELHPTMPEGLKGKIARTWSKYCRGKGPAVESACPRLRVVWVTCDGETAADREHIGPLHYTPFQGFMGAYFPFLNQEHYLGPLVWVQFRDLTPGVLVNIQCKLWAKNIQHDDNNPRFGGVHFEMLME